MALPTTISGIATTPACVGPFKSSGGNFYFFGKSSSANTDIVAMKATDPTSSFSSVASVVGSVAIQDIAGYQVSDVIHLGIVDDAGSSATIRYRTFDMSSDSFVVSETVGSGINTQNSGGSPQDAVSLVVRSNGNVVLFYNGPRVANMGNSYAQTYYRERTGVNTYGTQTQVSAGGQVDFIQPEIILGASDSFHLLFSNQTSTILDQRTLSSGNVLQTLGTQSARTPSDGNSYVSGGTTKVVVFAPDTGGSLIKVTYFDSGNTPTLNSSAQIESSSTSGFGRILIDGTDVWAIWISNGVGHVGDVCVAKSTDNGATFGAVIVAMAATADFSLDSSLSRDSNIILRAGSYVIGYFVNDNGTLKYNEYVVRVAVIPNEIVQTKQAVKRAAFW